MGLWGNIKKEDQTKCEIGTQSNKQQSIKTEKEKERRSESLLDLRESFVSHSNDKESSEAYL